MKLSKTAQKLLQEAAEADSGLVAVHTGYISGRRGCPSYGSRRFAGATALEADELLAHVKSTRGTHHFIGGFSADHYTEHVYRITELGKQKVGRAI